MSNKVRFGGQSDEVRRAVDAERDAANSSSKLTMMQRRVRTFFLAVDEIVFPEEAPSWAPDWVEWLLTGEVAAVTEELETVEAEREVAAKASINSLDAELNAAIDAEDFELLEPVAADVPDDPDLTVEVTVTPADAAAQLTAQLDEADAAEAQADLAAEIPAE